VNVRSAAATRPTIIIAAIAALLLSALLGFRPSAAAAFTAGDNGHPFGGPYSDLNGGTATFTFQANATLTCDQEDNASSFSFHVDYSVTGTLPAGASLVIYLSPNQGAINGNSGGDDAGYIQDVESNWGTKDVGGLTGSGSFDFTLSITSSFQLVTGGVLGVFASEDPSGEGAQQWTGKTNSLNCSEEEQSVAESVAESVQESVAESVAESVQESVAESVEQSVAESQAESVAESVPETGEQSVKAGTGTPGESQSDTAMGLGGSNPLPTIAFGLILLASLSGLAFVNVKAVRNRN
jgi:hypothetical protein